jgi:hypothetical protein
MTNIIKEWNPHPLVSTVFDMIEKSELKGILTPGLPFREWRMPLLTFLEKNVLKTGIWQANRQETSVFLVEIQLLLLEKFEVNLPSWCNFYGIDLVRHKQFCCAWWHDIECCCVVSQSTKLCQTKMISQNLNNHFNIERNAYLPWQDYR